MNHPALRFLAPVLGFVLLATMATAQDRTVVFGVGAAGESKAITEWGLDTAWPSYDNMRRGVTYMGADQVDLVRVTFPMNSALTGGTLTTAQIADVDYRVSLANLAGANKPLAMTADTGAGVDPWFKSGSAVIPDRWALAMGLTRQAFADRGHVTVSASPFNEPDYGWNQGTITNLYDILGLLQANPSFNGVTLAGGSTLNCDQANTWYNPIKTRVGEGTTHQLAGSFDSYAAFYQNVAASGGKGVNEELHNVGEAIVGAEYGVQRGIWWGSAELTRASFVKANQGQRLGYAEHRPNWTAAAVYRAPTGAVQAFVGSSERQAVTTTYRFYNRDRKVFYDGHGPRYDYSVTIPGGTGYQTGQTNAETVVNVTWGADAPPAIGGRYALVNRNSRKVMEVASASTGDGANIQQRAYTGATNQLWDVTSLDSRSGGDYAYFTLAAAHSGKAADLLNWSYNDGGNIIQWPAGGGANQSWFFEYVGDGWFNIRNRWSGKYLDVSGGSTADGANIFQWTGTGGLNQQWRLIPAGAAVEFFPPAAPTGLAATAGALSVSLAWNPVVATDLGGYTVLRADSAAGPFEIIARDVVGTSYTDESANRARPYYYALRAVDRSLNRSTQSATASATPTGGSALVARYAAESDSTDSSGNANHAGAAGTPAYAAGRIGATSFDLDGSTRYLNLPPGVADYDQLTVATWVYWNGGAAWQRIFDFGNGTGQYLFLTPAASGAGLRFAIKNGGAEQQLNSASLPSGSWVHVAVTLGAADARLFVNGAQVATSTAITLRPGDFSPVLNHIGKSQWPDPLFNGRIDDFRLYNYALTPTEVAALAAGPLPAPASLTVVAGPENISLSWSPLTWATSYTVRYASTPGGPFSVLASGITGTGYIHPNLAYGQTYYYTVEAGNIGGTGPATSVASATAAAALITAAEVNAAHLALAIGGDSGSTATLTLPVSVVGHFYQVQFTPDLTQPWSNIGTQISGTGGPLSVSLPPQPSGPRAFYRVLIQR